MNKKITAALLVFAMLFSFVLPVTEVQATEVTSQPETEKVAEINGTQYDTLQAALDAAAAIKSNDGQDQVTVEILKDIDLQGVDWQPVTLDSPNYANVIVNGNNHTITHLNDMLFGGTFGGGSGLVINDLTIADSAIVHDQADSEGNIGVGAFVGYPQASEGVTLYNCHLQNSSVEGGHWAGGLVGIAGGYSGNDGPVFMTLTMKNCSVENSKITSKGSAGSIIGHAACDAWTKVDITNCTATGNTVTSSGDSAHKAGIVMGTIGAAGVEKNGQTGGVFVKNFISSNNTATSNATSITTIYGRKGSDGGRLTIDGGQFDKAPANAGDVAEAGQPATEERFVTQTGNITLDYIAQVGDQKYLSLQEAIDAAPAGATVTLLKDTTGDRINVTKSLTIDGNKHTLTDATNEGRAIWIDATDVTLNLKDLTIDGQGKCQRGVQANRLDNGNTWNNASINIDNCTIKGMTHYAINLCFNTTVDLNITDSTISGWAAINAYGTGNKINVLRSTLNGLNDKSKSNSNNFCTVCLEGDTTGHSTVGSADYDVVITDSKITAKQTTGNQQAAIGFNTNSKNSKVVLNNTEVTLDDTKNCSNWYDDGTGNSIVVNSGTFTADPSECVAPNSVVTKDTAGKFVVAPLSANNATAQVGDAYYKSLPEAVAAVQDGGTITLLKDAKGPGVKVDSNSQFTIDLNNHEYSVINPTVGSTGTETNGFQLLKDSTIVIKNGTITADTGSAKILIQNYADLTLDGVTINAGPESQYMLSNNNGNVVIKNSKIDTTKSNYKGKVAFDVCSFSSYPSVKVTVEQSDIIGDIEWTGQNNDKYQSELIINGGSFNGAINVGDYTPNIKVYGGSFTQNPSAYVAPGYEATKGSDGKYTVAIEKVAQIGEQKYATLQEAVDAAKGKTTITLLKTVEGNGVKVPAGKDIIFDFDGHTYTINTKTVGSTGTETNGFQLLKGSTVVMKNGTLDAGTSAKILVQKYNDLTLEDMNLVGGPQTNYVLSNNNAKTILKGNTNITAAEGKVAFDVYYWPANGYGDNRVVTENLTGTITGKIEHTHDDTVDDAAMKTNSGISLTSGSYTVNPKAFVAEGYKATSVDGKYTVAFDQAPVDNVIAKIKSIGEVAFTEESKAAIDAARTAYDDLSKAGKAKVNNFADLEAAEDKYAELKEADDKAVADANAAVEKIKAIGDVAFTKESKGKIDAARTAYDGLSEAAKAKVSAEQLKVLTDAEASYKELKDADDQATKAAKAVDELIAEIGDVTLESKDKIDAARKAYDKLSKDAQAKVTEKQLKVLTDAEASYKELKDADDQAKEAAKAVDGLIAEIGDVTLESKDTIEAARKAYDKLSKDAQAKVTKLDTLKAAEAKYAELKAADNQAASEAKAVVEKIEAIGEVTLQSKGKIDAARTAYDSLSEAAKVKVSTDKVAVLTNAEAAYKQLVAEAPDKEAAKAVDALITGIGDVILDKEQQVKSARKAYNELKDSQKRMVKNIDQLKAAEAKIVELKDNAAVDAVEKLIDAIGTVNSNSKAKIDAAKDAYRHLPEADRAKVSNKEKLVQAESDFAVVMVKDKIAKIGDVSYTPECEQAILSAEVAYNKLTDTQKQQVNNSEELTSARSHYNALKNEADQAAVDEVVGLIDAIGTVDSASDELKKKIIAADKAYNGLTADQQKLIDQTTIDKLENAKADWQEAWKVDQSGEPSEPTVNKETATGGTEAEIPQDADITPDQKKNVQEAAKGTEVTHSEAAAEQLAAAAKATSESLSNEDLLEAQKQLNKEVFDSVDKEVTVVTQTYMEVQPKAYKPEVSSSDEEGPKYTVDIKPMVRIVATTTETNVENIKLDGADKNAVPVGEPQEVELENAPVVVKIPLPEGFAEVGSTIFVKHVKEDGRVYNYKCVVQEQDGMLYIAFNNTHGFSEFSVEKQSNTVASITRDDTTECFDSLDAAIKAVQNNETIKLEKDCAEAVKVTGKTVRFVLDENGHSFTGAIEAGANTVREANEMGLTYSFTYTAPVFPGGGMVIPPVEENTITIDAADNGKVVADPAKAKEGDVVTLTATPDKGYALDCIVVTDEAGKKVETVAVDGQPNKVTFTMPAGKVTVKATFKKVEEKPEASFSDVAGNEWFADAVKYVVDKDIMNGVGDNRFAPNASTTRGMIVTMLYNMEEKPAVSGDKAFSDVADTDWFSNGVWWAAKNGIVKGYEDGTFQPNKEISRQEMALILYNYAQYKGYDLAANADLSSFKDADQIGTWAEQAMKWANGHELITGMGNGMIAPAGDATRAQVASIFMRFCENIAK